MMHTNNSRSIFACVPIFSLLIIGSVTSNVNSTGRLAIKAMIVTIGANQGDSDSLVYPYTNQTAPNTRLVKNHNRIEMFVVFKIGSLNG